MRRHSSAALPALGLILGLGACATVPTPPPSALVPLVRVYNQSTVPVTLVVNGSPVALISARSLADPVRASFPDRPWDIQLKLPSGRSLETLQIPAGTITVGSFVTGASQCGSIYLAVADPLPAGEPAFSPDPSAASCE